MPFCFHLQAKEDKVTVDDELIVTEGTPDFLFDADATATFKIDIQSDRCIVVEYHDDTIQVLGTIDQYNESRGEDWVRDWPQVVECMERKNGANWPLLGKKEYFKMIAPQILRDTIKQMEEDLKHLKYPMNIKIKTELGLFKQFHQSYRFEDESAVKYDILMHLDTLDMGNTAASITAAALSGWATARAMEKMGGAIGVGYVDVTDRATGETVCHIKLNRLKGQGAGSEKDRLTSLSSYVFIELFKMAKKENKAQKGNKKKK